jgi:hypothetical protein
LDVGTWAVYWQPHWPAPATSARSVACDGFPDLELEPEPDPEFDELVECVGGADVEAAGVDPVPELPWVSDVAPALDGVAGVGV